MSGMGERFDGAIDGRPSEPQDVDGLSRFVEDVRAVFPEESLLAEAAHIEAVLDAARRIPAAGRVGPDRKEGRVRIPRFTLRTMRAKVAAASVVVVAMFGGLATAGALPGADDEIVEAPETQETEELVAEFEDLDDVLEDVANHPEDEAEADEQADAADEADEADEQADADDAEDESDDQDEANDEAEDESDDDANEDESDDDSDDDSDDNTSDDEEDDDSEDGGSDD